MPQKRKKSAAVPSFVVAAQEWINLAEALLGGEPVRVILGDWQWVPMRGAATWTHNPERLRLLAATDELLRAMARDRSPQGELVFPLHGLRRELNDRSDVAVGGPWTDRLTFGPKVRRVEPCAERDAAEAEATRSAAADLPFGGFPMLRSDLVELVRRAVARWRAVEGVRASPAEARNGRRLTYSEVLTAARQAQDGVSLRTIAEGLGVSHQALSRHKEVKSAIGLRKAAVRLLPEGFKDADGTLDGWSNDDRD